MKELLDELHKLYQEIDQGAGVLTAKARIGGMLARRHYEPDRQDD